MKNNTELKGALLTLTAGIFWGISGNFANFIFENKIFNPAWLTTIRLFSAGVILILVTYSSERNHLFEIWKNKKDLRDLFIFSIFGVSASQFTYFITIQNSNAATATVIQYLGPALIIIYLIIRYKRIPSKVETCSVICALIGIFLIATHGNINKLVISQKTLIFGLMSAVALAVYSIQPVNLLKKWGSSITVGWAMLIGGIILMPIYRPWSIAVKINLVSMCMLIFIVIFGTIFSFGFYLQGVKYIGASKASLFACIEPLAATFFSVVWLKVPLTFIDYVGFSFIVLTMFLLSLKGK